MADPKSAPVTPPAPEPAPAPAPAPAESRRDREIRKAADAELDRQAAVVEAVDQAHRDELPKLGGPLRDPGLGR